MKLKFTWRIWLMIILLIFSLVAIFGIPPNFLQKGVMISSVEPGSMAFERGLRQGQILQNIDGKEISNLDDFTEAIKNKFPMQEKEKVIIKTNKIEVILFTNSSPEITVSEIKDTNIKTGLDLAGGARALVKAENKELTSEEIRDLVDITSNRLNEFGLTDLEVLPVSDLSGNNYMLIEIAGATPDDLEELVSKQGKFEAKIGNQTVFVGGERDISSVCKSGSCSRLESPQQSEEGYVSNFMFTITLSEGAAKRHAEITDEIPLSAEEQGYLEEKLELFLDDNLVNSLYVSEGLKGIVETQIQISGVGSGETPEQAVSNAQEKMKKLQTVLMTGSLPYKLEIVKLDTISPTLGKDFIHSILLAGLAAIFAVAIIVFFRYRNFKSSLALILTSISEVTIILGIASFIGWNLDLPSIAGILATIGTGIDSQIIVLDEAHQHSKLSIKQKLKRAFKIIIGAWLTALVALIPLWWAGAGLLKGFAITTIIGITTGVLVTRPAFTDIIKKIEG